MSISLDDYGYGQKLTEGVMRALVTHSTNHEQLATLARPYGYTGGAQLGVAVRVNHETGGVLGSVMKLFGEGNPVVMEAKVPARRVWLTASRQLELSLQIRVSRKPYSLRTRVPGVTFRKRELSENSRSRECHGISLACEIYL